MKSPVKDPRDGGTSLRAQTLEAAAAVPPLGSVCIVRDDDESCEESGRHLDPAGGAPPLPSTPVAEELPWYKPEPTLEEVFAHWVAPMKSACGCPGEVGICRICTAIDNNEFQRARRGG